MNIVSNGMLIVSAVCLTLALIHLRFGFTGRSRWSHLLFAASALSTAAYALTERALLLVDSPEEYAAIVRLSGITSAFVVVSTTWFVYFYLESQRKWLLWTITILRVLALFLNVVLTPNGGFRSITEINKIDILGELISVPVLTPSPLRLVGQSVLLLFVIFCVDAGIGAWRRGRRQRAAIVGGGAALFGMFTFLMSVLSLWGFVEWPITASPLFLVIIVATAYELNRDVFHATELARQLTESKALLDESVQRLNLSANAANVGIWTRKVGKMVIEASPKWNEMFGFEPSQAVTRDQFRSRIHPDDLDMVVGHTTAMEEFGNDFEYEFRIVLPSGEVRWMASSGKVELAGGKPYILRGASVDITNRKLAEESTKDLAAIVESSDDAIYRKTLGGVITTWNRGAERIFGYSAAEIIGQNVSILAPDDLQDEVIDVRKKVGRGEPIYHLETERVTRDGRRINVSITVSPIKDATGKVIASSTSARDITKRKLALEAARKSDERNRDLLRALPDLIFMQTPAGVYVDYHVSDPRQLFVPADDFMGRNMSEILPPELASEFRRAFDLAMETGEPQVVEYQLPIDGVTGWYEARIIRGADEQILSVVRDITAKKLAEAQLKDSQAELAGLVGSAFDAIIFINEKGKIVLFNHAAERILKVTADEAIGESLDRFIPERFRAAYGDAIREFGKTGEMHNLPTPLYGRRATGEDFPLEASFSHVEVNGQSFFTVIVRDITRRIHVEQALRESEERFRNMADTAPVMIWVTGTDTLCTYVNQGWLRFTGRTMEQELGNGWVDGVHPDDLDHSVQIYTSAFDRREVFTLDYRLRRADGMHRWIYAAGSPRFSYDGEFLGYIGSCVDITDQKEATEALSELGGRLINAQEVERTRVARELHDDSSQSLALLSIKLDGLTQKINEPAILKKEVDELKLHIQKLSLDLHRISHELHPAKLEQLGLESAIRGFCREISEAHGLYIEFKGADLSFDVPNDISLCLYRVTQESLHNIVKHSAATSVNVNLELRDDELCLCVTDNGIGFDPKTEKFKGSLGLVSMNERLRSVQGTLTLESTPGSGSKVVARVPHIGEPETA